MYSRGLGDGPCQVPQPGVTMIFPPCPASAPIGSGIPAASYTSSGGPAVYQAPDLVPVPACSQDTRPGGAAFSDACQTQLRAVQQQNMQLGNNANYAVDLQNCLNTFPQPPDCYQRSFGLTPTGGYTSDAIVQGPGGQVILDAAGKQVANPYVTATPPTPSAAPISSPARAGSGQTNYVPLTQQAAAILGGNVDVGGFNLPVLGIAAAALAAFMLFGGKR